MPHNDSLTPKNHAFNILFGQTPLTKFTNYEKAIKVDLIKYDNPADMLNGTFDFVKATWSLDGRESERASPEEMNYALSQMLSGKALGLGLETVNFMFRISGISRVDTHQIVRQRIGVTFSQQCSGDQFWNHMNCLVEPSIYHSKFNFTQFVSSTIQNKLTYASLVDDGVSIQAARSILPHNLETFIFMNVNLATLLFFHMKRINDGSQTWQINNIAQQMADKVCHVFPQLTEVFERNKSKFTFQKEASEDRKNSFSTGLYLPIPDDFEYHNRDFLYPFNKTKMHLVKEEGQDFGDLYYWGNSPVSEMFYNEATKAYNSMNKFVHENHFTNPQIYSIGKEVSKTLTLLENTYSNDEDLVESGMLEDYQLKPRMLTAALKVAGV